MLWKKLGRVYAPKGDQWWAKEYASFPTVDAIGAGRLRVYFSALDDSKYGRVGAIEVNENDPTRIIKETREPLLDLGDIGTFDDSGVNVFAVVNFGGRKLVYYQGWQRTERIPYLIFTGLAISDDNGVSYKKHSRLPILERTELEPFMRGAPCVLNEKGQLRMWYVSAVKWAMETTGPRYEVVIRHASSGDGIAWQVTPDVCLAPRMPDEYAVGRPWVVFDGQKYRMWFSSRTLSSLYALGYAESADGLTWTRSDRPLSGLGKSPEGWDSQMICYPCVHVSNGRALMFYNGNRHGQSGFGVAEAAMPGARA